MGGRLFHSTKLVLFNEVYLWRRASYKNFIIVYLALPPPPNPAKVEWYMKQFLKVFSQNKRTHTHALYVYGYTIFNAKRD